MNATASTKTKQAVRPKFYSVRVGHRPGIYENWDECFSQVKGVKGATFKSFSKFEEAQEFLSGGVATDLDPNCGAAGRKFYAVKSGRMPGIYTDWLSAKEQIIGWSKPRHKCFATRAEAQRYLGGADTCSLETGCTEGSRALLDYHPGTPPNKRHKPGHMVADNTVVNRYGKGAAGDHAMLDSHVEDGFDATMTLDPATGRVVHKTPLQAQATRLLATGPVAGSIIKVYTDGSSLGNGGKRAFAGVGVYFGPGDSKNISEPLSGPRQTNQRAELTAILRALEALPMDRNVELVTDSQYSIKCITEWCKNWQRNGWKNAAGKPVENKDLVESVLHRMQERSKQGTTTKYTWTKGHATNKGNIAADKLAVNGARVASELAQASHEVTT